MARRALTLALLVAGGAFVATRSDRGRAAASDALEAAIKLMQPRGIRNNNPGNIEWIARESSRWRGMVNRDGRYGVFDTIANGVRAIGGELRANFRRGENTVRDIINEWAPPSENNTSAYVDAVAKRLGVGADEPLSSARIPELAAAIIHHENGVQPYSAADIAAWVNS